MTTTTLTREDHSLYAGTSTTAEDLARLAARNEISVHVPDLKRCDDESCPKSHLSRLDVPRAVHHAYGPDGDYGLTRSEVEIMPLTRGGFIARVRTQCMSGRGSWWREPSARDMRAWIDDLIAESGLNLKREGRRETDGGAFSQWMHRYTLAAR